MKNQLKSHEHIDPRRLVIGLIIIGLNAPDALKELKDELDILLDIRFKELYLVLQHNLSQPLAITITDIIIINIIATAMHIINARRLSDIISVSC